jgi:hypothetical protein
MLCRIRSDLCWVGLFPLNLGHLADRMLFARCRKQGRRKENSEDALAKEGTHNSLAQLSASAAMRKDESAVVRRDGRAGSSMNSIISKSNMQRQRKSCD